MLARPSKNRRHPSACVARWRHFVWSEFWPPVDQKFRSVMAKMSREQDLHRHRQGVRCDRRAGSAGRGRYGDGKDKSHFEPGQRTYRGGSSIALSFREGFGPPASGWCEIRRDFASPKGFARAVLTRRARHHTCANVAVKCGSTAGRCTNRRPRISLRRW